MATLNISDLSVGDWVMVNGKPRKISVLSEVWNGTMLVGYVDVNPNRLNGVFYKPIEQVKPIPITAEILEKNGWNSDGMYATLRIDEHLHLEYYFHEHRLRKYYCGVDEWQNHAKVTDITFAAHCYSVHQLQHALRLAGGEKERIKRLGSCPNFWEYSIIKTTER